MPLDVCTGNWISTAGKLDLILEYSLFCGSYCKVDGSSNVSVSSGMASSNWYSTLNIILANLSGIPHLSKIFCNSEHFTLPSLPTKHSDVTHQLII